MAKLRPQNCGIHLMNKDFPECKLTTVFTLGIQVGLPVQTVKTLIRLLIGPALFAYHFIKHLLVEAVDLSTFKMEEFISRKDEMVLRYGGNRNKNFLFISKDQNIFLLNAEFLQIKVLVQKNLHYHNYT